jgi:hypothetical protein
VDTDRHGDIRGSRTTKPLRLGNERQQSRNVWRSLGEAGFRGRRNLLWLLGPIPIVIALIGSLYAILVMLLGKIVAMSFVTSGHTHTELQTPAASRPD